MDVDVWSNRIIRWGFYLLFILVPIILTPWNYELFEYNKMMLTYALTVVIIGGWLVKMIHARELRVTRTPLDIPLGLFVASQLVSTLFSIDPHVSWFGYYSRFNGGMFSILTYTLLYYAFVTNFGVIAAGAVEKTKKSLMGPVAFRITRLLKVILTTGAVVSLYGVLEHFGIDKNLWVQDVQSRVFSTLGQPNWLAAYLVALVPAAIALAFASNNFLSVSSITWGLASVLFFVVTIFTRSRSGYLGLAVADAVFFLTLWAGRKNKKILKIPFIVIHVAFLVVIFFNGTYIEQVDSWVTLSGWRARLTHQQVAPAKPQMTPAGTALESGGTESGTIRKYVWQGAINAWKGSPKNIAIGTGTETFAFAFYQYRPAAHNLTSEWDFLYNKAHNEYLNYLATTGLFGLGSYVLFILTFIVWFLRHQKDYSDGTDLISRGLFAGWISLLITNFFGFSVVVIQLLFFLIPAMLLVMDQHAHEAKTYMVPLRLTKRTGDWSSYAVLLAVLIILTFLYRFWQADTFYATANRLGRASLFPKAQSMDAQAIALNPGEPVYHDDMASVLAALALSAVQEKNATLSANLAKQSLTESDKAIAISPKNVNFWKTRTKLFYTFSTFDPTLNQAAISALETARTLSPADPKIYYNLAILYGRANDNATAVKLLEEAKALKADYRDAYFGLYVFYTEMKQPAQARAQLQSYLTTVDPNDKDFQDRLKQP